VDSIPFIDIHTHHLQESDETVRVINRYPGEDIPVFNGRNFFSVGLHPWKIKTEDENNQSLLMMEDALELDHVIFVGECGLDKLAETDFNEQKRVFQIQAFMAEEFRTPLIIHCVKAWNEILELLNKNKPTVPWIFHGYNGNAEISRQLSRKKALFSFGELLFRENSKAIESLRLLPLHKIFFETDDFESPVSEIFNRAAELKNVSAENLKKIVWQNFNRIENVRFDI
jgi:TatD DNase family protein